MIIVTLTMSEGFDQREMIVKGYQCCSSMCCSVLLIAAAFGIYKGLAPPPPLPMQPQLAGVSAAAALAICICCMCCMWYPADWAAAYTENNIIE